jgi:hypothetical protein
MSRLSGKLVAAAALGPRAASITSIDRWRDVTTAVVLGLTAVASAWSGHIASRWLNYEAMQVHQSHVAGRLSTEYTIAATEHRTFDLVSFLEYARLLNKGNTAAAAALREQLRPDAKAALDSWLASGPPLMNKGATSTPFVMPLYQMSEEKEATRYTEEAERRDQNAERAGTFAARYGFLTVLCGLGLFFAGLRSQFAGRPLGLVLIGFSIALLLIVGVGLLRLPRP